MLSVLIVADRIQRVWYVERDVTDKKTDGVHQNVQENLASLEEGAYGGGCMRCKDGLQIGNLTPFCVRSV